MKSLKRFKKVCSNILNSFKISNIKDSKRDDKLKKIILLCDKYRKKVRKRDIIEIIIFLLAILLICLVINKLNNDPEKIVKDYLQLVADKKYNESHKYLNEEAKVKNISFEKSLNYYIDVHNLEKKFELHVLEKGKNYITYSIPVIGTDVFLKKRYKFLIFEKYEIAEFSLGGTIPYKEKDDKFVDENFEPEPEETNIYSDGFYIITLDEKAYEEIVKAFKDEEIFFINTGEDVFIEKKLNDFYKKRYEKLKELRNKLKSVELEEFYIKDIVTNDNTKETKVTVNAKYKYIYKDSAKKIIKENIVYTIVIENGKYLVINEIIEGS
ncbi:MAG: hypothetical protein JW924_08510 [Fusobacteriaceae bacterium]|nr:hypothetical protein [Fusobacteriaceae bacterium]